VVQTLVFAAPRLVSARPAYWRESFLNVQVQSLTCQGFDAVSFINILRVMWLFVTCHLRVVLLPAT
jgi:hypothetical protein